jgi:hypothetical protein
VITTQGLFRLTADEYHMDPCPAPSLSSSIAKILIEQSPAHAWMAHPRLNLQYEREVNSTFDLGSAAHTLLLEKNRGDRIIIVDAKDWRTNAAKEAREAATAAGKFAVLTEQYDRMCCMVVEAQNFIALTELAQMFEHGMADGMAETTVVWQEGNLWFRAKPDLMSADRRIILDYKTTENAEPETFSKQIGRMSYDLQAEFYTRGITVVNKFDGTIEEPTFVFLVQETHKPYACSLIGLSAAYRSVGQSKVKRAIKIWDQCMTSKTWGGYPTQIAYAEPKPWDLAEAEELNSDVVSV